MFNQRTITKVAGYAQWIAVGIPVGIQGTDDTDALKWTKQVEPICGMLWTGAVLTLFLCNHQDMARHPLLTVITSMIIYAAILMRTDLGQSSMIQLAVNFAIPLSQELDKIVWKEMRAQLPGLQPWTENRRGPLLPQ